MSTTYQIVYPYVVIKFTENTCPWYKDSINTCSHCHEGWHRNLLATIHFQDRRGAAPLLCEQKTQKKHSEITAWTKALSYPIWFACYLGFPHNEEGLDTRKVFFKAFRCFNANGALHCQGGRPFLKSLWSWSLRTFLDRKRFYINYKITFLDTYTFTRHFIFSHTCKRYTYNDMREKKWLNLVFYLKFERTPLSMRVSRLHPPASRPLTLRCLGVGLNKKYIRLRVKAICSGFFP